MSTLATDALGDVFAPTHSPAPLQPIRVGLAGLGLPGLAHAAVLSAMPNSELTGVADERRVARREARALGFRVPGFAGVEKLLEKGSPQALVVSAAFTHAADAATAALEAGVDVLLDRPLELSRADADRLIALAAEHGRKLVFAMPIVHHAVFGQVPRLLEGGVMGRTIRASGSIMSSRMIVDPRPHGRAAPNGHGGVLARMAPDLLFGLVWYLGVPIHARATATRHGDHPEDEIAATLELADGTQVRLDASWQTAGYPRPATVIEIDGENGRLLASDDGIELELSEGRGVFDSGHTRLGLDRLPQRARLDQGGDAVYVQDASFLAWATGGEPPADAAERLRAVFALRDALYASAERNGEIQAVTP